MQDPARTVLAGLVSGVFVLTASAAGLGLGVLSLVVGGSFVVVATMVLAATRFRLSSVVLTWCLAVAVATLVFAPIGGPPSSLGLLLLAVVAGAVHGSLAVGPWLLGTAALRHLLAGSAPQRGQDLEDLHT